MEESKAEKPKWVKMKSADLEKRIIDLAKNGNPPEMIGIILRDEHGVPKTKAILNKRISQVLKEAGIEIEPESKRTKEKIEKIKIHFAKHKHDYTSSKALTKKLWQLRKQTQ